MAIDRIDEMPLPATPQANRHSPHSFSELMIQESIQTAGILVRKWDPSSPSLETFSSLFQENRKEAQEFIMCVENLRTAMDFLVEQRSSSELDQLVQANSLMKIAMLRLEKEFYYALSANRDCFNLESVSSGSSGHSRSLSFGNVDEEEDDDHIVLDRVSKVERAISDLKLIAECMIGSGYGKESGEIYRIARKSIVDEQLYRLGIGSCNQSQIMRMDQNALEKQVSRWIEGSKVAVRTIFHGERLLCDHVFAVSETIKQTCIAHTTLERAVNLFKFPEMVAKCKRSPEKVFVLMNLFETISDLWPEIESIFSYKSLSPVSLQALSSIQKLSDSAQTTLAEFVSSIQKNSSKVPTPGGGIHPLTYSVMDYVSLLAEYSGTLSDILTDDTDHAARSPFPESYFDSPSGGVASRLAWIILVLLCKLDSKAKLYKDVGLSYLFLANNLQFVVEKVNTTPLKLLLGHEWLSQLQKKVKLYTANYESVAWATVFSSLPAATESNPDAIKEHFRKFNSAFEAAYRKQKAWVVPDPKIRDEIKLSIARKVVPAYTEFYERSYMAMLSAEKNLEVLVRFSPDNLGNYLSDLFVTSVEFSEKASPSSSSQSQMGRCF